MRWFLLALLLAGACADEPEVAAPTTEVRVLERTTVQDLSELEARMGQLEADLRVFSEAFEAIPVADTTGMRMEIGRLSREVAELERLMGTTLGATGTVLGCLQAMMREWDSPRPPTRYCTF